MTGRWHFIGIGGSGMSSLAELLLLRGQNVSGSDLHAGAGIERLRGLGADVAEGHAAARASGAARVVVSSAIPASNLELREARARGIPICTRGALLAELMNATRGIAVAGTHGKTTTTAMIAHILIEQHLDPSAVIGGRVKHWQSGARHGQGELLIAEADESDGSFLQLAPQIAVVTNIEAEHLDHYRSLDALDDAFVAFINQPAAEARSCAVLNADDPGLRRLLPRVMRRSRTFGFAEDATLRAHALESDAGCSRLALRSGRETCELKLQLPGLHNAMNALAAILVACELCVPLDDAARALANFGGVERRFSLKGTASGVRVVDDYAHHPTEIRATLMAAREAHAGRIFVVFQPHRYTRTRDLFDDFATAFDAADAVLLSEIDPAGEKPIPGVEARALAEALRAHGQNVRFVADFAALTETLARELKRGDLLLTLGAGSIQQLGALVLARLGAAPVPARRRERAS